MKQLQADLNVLDEVVHLLVGVERCRLYVGCPPFRSVIGLHQLQHIATTAQFRVSENNSHTPPTNTSPPQHRHTDTCTGTQTHTHAHKHTHTHIHAHTQTHMRTHKHTCAHTKTHTHTQLTHTVSASTNTLPPQHSLEFHQRSQDNKTQNAAPNLSHVRSKTAVHTTPHPAFVELNFRLYLRKKEKSASSHTYNCKTAALK